MSHRRERTPGPSAFTRCGRGTHGRCGSRGPARGVVGDDPGGVRSRRERGLPLAGARWLGAAAAL